MSQADINRSMNEYISTVAASSAKQIEDMKKASAESNQRIEQSVTRIEQAVEANAFQIGQLSEHLASLDIKLERLIDTVNQQGAVAASQAATADKNADTVNRLTALVERLLERN